MLTARTLAEAQVYFALMRITGPDAPPLPDGPESTLEGTIRTEGEEAWTLSYGTEEEGRIEVAVPYGSEDVARRAGVVFGLGVSPLIDAGQWVMVAQVFAGRAFDRDFSLAGGSGTPQERRLVELDWEYAAEAQGEALKFVPEGAGVLPETAIWSELGQRALAEQPANLVPAKIADDHEYYRATLEDFRMLHGPSS